MAVKLRFFIKYTEYQYKNFLMMLTNRYGHYIIGHKINLETDNGADYFHRI